MEYKGKLYGKVGKNYIPLIHTSDDVDKMEKDIIEKDKKIDEITNVKHF